MRMIRPFVPAAKRRLAQGLVAFAVGLLPACSLAADAWTLSGRIVNVHDGDTVTLLDAQNRQHKIRLDGIDAPELGQAFGKASKRALQEQALRRDAQAACHKEDRYRREVCRVTVDGADTGLQQLQAGMAWVFRRYERELPSDTREVYDSAEKQARSTQRGLWSDREPQPPWDWRADHAPKAVSRPQP